MRRHRRTARLINKVALEEPKQGGIFDHADQTHGVMPSITANERLGEDVTALPVRVAVDQTKELLLVELVQPGYVHPVETLHVTQRGVLTRGDNTGRSLIVFVHRDFRGAAKKDLP